MPSATNDVAGEVRACTVGRPEVRRLHRRASDAGPLDGVQFGPRDDGRRRRDDYGRTLKCERCKRLIGGSLFKRSIEG